MTREALLARRAVLLPIYANPNPEHEMQAVEVACELAWIGEELKKVRREPVPVPMSRRASPGAYDRDGKALAAGEG